MDKIFQKLNIDPSSCELIRSKAGISVFRLEAGDEKLILKVFENPEDRREIANYQLLGQLGIPTLPVVGYTEEALLLPDVNASEKHRLGMGMAYGDVRNVISSMGKEALKAFCETYGVNGLDEEKLADDFLAHMITLCVASQREVFPAWAGESVEILGNGVLLKNFEQWIVK